MNKEILAAVICALVVTAWLYTNTEDARPPRPQQISAGTTMSPNDTIKFSEQQKRNQAHIDAIQEAKALDLASGEEHRF